MKSVFTSIKVLIIMTIITGVIYPLLITVIGQLIFPKQVNGSLVMQNNKIIGSEIIAQKFINDKYFSSRPSDIDYIPIPSGGSNYALTNKKLWEEVNDRKQSFIKKNFIHLHSNENRHSFKTRTSTPIPSEMIFTSASGLDPHISPVAVKMQFDKVIKARKFSLKQQVELLDLIDTMIEKPQLNILGEYRINVFLLNLGLDKIR